MFAVGKDTWSGRFAAPAADRTDGPLATCRALQAARLVRQTTPGPTEAITILLRGGTYELSEPVTLTATDSGVNAQQPFTLATPGEKPVASGADGSRWNRPQPARVMADRSPGRARGH